MHEPSGDRAGQLIGGKYFIDGLLARGGMGLIYAARHCGTGRAVAIKILRPELAGRSDLVRRVSAEARLAVEASHPNVVEVLDAGADDAGIPYVVLERLHGKPLDAFLESPVALVPTVQALLPILNALVSLHQAGILHRDIKPSNIFLSRRRDGRVTPKLLDFGIAKALEANGLTLSGTALGTPAYMAPEQALGAGDAGPATDVWSIAVVIVRCLTGRLPFEAPPQRRLGALKDGLQAADLVLVPAPLRAALSRALRFEPTERFATMDDFRAELLAELHAVDPDQPWPRIDTVSYASEATVLSSWLGAMPAEDPPPGDDLSSLRRPADVDTRTLPAMQTGTSMSIAGVPRRSARGRRTLPLLALAALGSLALIGGLIAGDDDASPELPASAQSSVNSLEPAPNRAPLRAPSDATPTLNRASDLPVVIAAPREESERAASTARQKAAPAPSSAPSQRSPSVKEPKPAESSHASAAEVSLPKPVIGANRAPIIE